MKYLHGTSGGIYEFICNAFTESSQAPVVVYKSEKDGRVWVRPYSEFHDGRFMELPESEKPKFCPHANPFKFCNTCPVDPCPLGLGVKK